MLDRFTAAPRIPALRRNSQKPKFFKKKTKSKTKSPSFLPKTSKKDDMSLTFYRKSVKGDDEEFAFKGAWSGDNIYNFVEKHMFPNWEEL
jgi:hypothetical protein